MVRIAVVGCGSGGPAAAIYFAQGGHEVELYERVPELHPVGAGFMLQPTGLEVLSELGVLEAVLGYGERLDNLTMVTRRGRRIIDLDYAEVAAGMYGVGIHRASMLDALVGEMRRRDIPLHLGVEVTDVARRGAHYLLATANGERGPFDLVVVADGARSALRTQLGIRASVRRYKWGALWFMGHDPARDWQRQLYQIVDGTQTLLGLLPTGTTPDDDHELVSLFWSIEVAREPELKASGIDAWKDTVVALEPRAQAIVDQIGDWNDLTLAVYHDVIMRSWHHNGVVFIGDAAHATSPQLGQGANLALCDARALARAVDTEPDLERALARYDRARKRHLRFYQWASRWLTPFFQSRSWPLGAIRNLAFPIAMRIAPIRRQGVRTMAGLKRGLVRRSLPPPRV